eukprot:TRINITY_DN4779_c0_g1_i1.p1 TRINITY_DN4779_c0_g1~~TRINITY_DN4779_c0_g1_i1.p1  ORF type:complete len:157 (+),score=37.16 TRINITY_DN4779_c0_g1_i1:35-505(+)
MSRIDPVALSGGDGSLSSAQAPRSLRQRRAPKDANTRRRDKLLMWLEGEDVFHRSAHLERSIIVGIFCTLAVSLGFTLIHSCAFGANACAAERERLERNLAETARLKKAIRDLRHAAGAVQPLAASAAMEVVARVVPGREADRQLPSRLRGKDAVR